MRNLTTPLDNILSLISCAEDYGFANNVLFDAFGEMMGYKLSNEEIESYAQSVAAQKDYGSEDYAYIKETLKAFKENFCK